VTARLSRAFYDRFGEALTNELVDWFNQVDATYRSDLRELNEGNFSRFDSRLNQRFAESDLRLEQRLAGFEQRIAAFEVRVEQRLAAFEQRIAAFEVRVEQRLAVTEQRLAAFEVRVEQRLAKQLRWMIGLWLTTMLALLGIFLRVG
jgi:hypothetical protein